MNHELSLGLGVLPADAYYKGYYAGLSYTYHFSDSFAWQVGRGGYSYNVKTSLRRQLERDFGVAPTNTAFEDEVEWMVGSDLMFSPFYGKTAILNSKVIHFEAFLLGGASIFKLNHEGGFRPGANLGLAIRVFKSDTVSFRLRKANAGCGDAVRRSHPGVAGNGVGGGDGVATRHRGTCRRDSPPRALAGARCGWRCGVAG
jgi:outer membrane beta-barrel protein